ncbi:uncharacterized protein LOC104906381 [Beta vulgaris subsp. vulgaris]|uniref:uncharacterized protein LOC104906381 n=1 Tax=Beta vulgaris subsp. vulgaris TaxID=3555 RepID=UPI002547A97F|nr:uncharacterized protein LOC104906381 [Beta vulgaris subsp. vulgaris]
MPSEAFQQWVDNIEKINLETEMELTRLKYEGDSQIERLKYEREAQNERVLLENRKVSMKQNKINLELFKVLASKDYLTEEEENLKSHLVKKDLETYFPHNSENVIIKLSMAENRPYATGRLGASTLLKCTAAIRLLAYATSADLVDDYLKISGSLARDSLQHFVEGVVAEFGDEYLRRPNETDLTRLLYAGEERGIPGMMGSIDCMHWRWKNCPLQFKGLYSGRAGKPTLILKAIASYDLWIWHAFFGTPSRCNDINVLDRSPIFNDVFEGRAPPVSYVINGHQYDMGYYLIDGIYPQWAAFIPTISLPLNEKESLFAQKQESKRKDVERAFGVLQARFAIIGQPALARDKYMLGKIMFTCIIIHNMITV